MVPPMSLLSQSSPGCQWSLIGNSIPQALPPNAQEFLCLELAILLEGCFLHQQAKPCGLYTLEKKHLLISP